MFAILLKYLKGPLDVDLDDQILTAAGNLLTFDDRRTVKIAVNFRVFEKVAMSSSTFKFITRNEEIFASVFLAKTFRPRCVRDRKAKVGQDAANFFD